MFDRWGPSHPFRECEHRWLVDPERHSEIAKIARELALSRASRLLSEGSSIEQRNEAAFEIERFLRLLRSSIHRPIRDPGNEGPNASLWNLAGSEIRKRLAGLSEEDREYVVKNGDRFWPDLPDPQQAEFITHPQLLDELAHAYLEEEPGSSRTLVDGGPTLRRRRENERICRIPWRRISVVRSCLGLGPVRWSAIGGAGSCGAGNGARERQPELVEATAQ